MAYLITPSKADMVYELPTVERPTFEITILRTGGGIHSIIQASWRELIRWLSAFDKCIPKGIFDFVSPVRQDGGGTLLDPGTLPTS